MERSRRASRTSPATWAPGQPGVHRDPIRRRPRPIARVHLPGLEHRGQLGHHRRQPGLLRRSPSMASPSSTSDTIVAVHRSHVLDHPSEGSGEPADRRRPGGRRHRPVRPRSRPARTYVRIVALRDPHRSASGRAFVRSRPCWARWSALWSGARRERASEPRSSGEGRPRARSAPTCASVARSHPTFRAGVAVLARRPRSAGTATSGGGRCSGGGARSIYADSGVVGARLERSAASGDCLTLELHPVRGVDHLVVSVEAARIVEAMLPTA